MEIDVKALQGKILYLATKEGFLIENICQLNPIPIVALTKKSKTKNAPHVFLSSGIHGDEPAGPFAILKLLEAVFFENTFNWYVFPMLNPTGLQLGTRENIDGIDLNRDYRKRSTKEVAAHIAWFERLPINQFDLACNLHEDWETNGFYLYGLDKDKNVSFIPAIMKAIEAVCPIETSQEIEGMKAINGVIQIPDNFESDLIDLREDWPESFYIVKKFNPLFKYTFETPSQKPLEQRITAHCEGLMVCLRELKAFHRLLP